MWCIPHLLWGNEMDRNIVGHIVVALMSKFLAKAVIQQAASRHPEIIESRDQGETRFLAFATVTANEVDGVINRLGVLADRLGNVNTQENMDEFRTAVDKEVKLMVDAGLAAFNNIPQCSQVEPRPGQPAH